MRLETRMRMKLQTLYDVRAFPCLEACNCKVCEDASWYGA